MWGTTGCDIVVLGRVIVRKIVGKLGSVGDGNGVDGDDGSVTNGVILEVAHMGFRLVCGLRVVSVELYKRDGDESTHQILSYGLLFSTFYRFPYTADPPTSTAPSRPSPNIARTFAIVADYTLYPSHHWSGTTSETSHMTYGPHHYISLS